jgi:D-amino-acid dehydrogenase
MDVIVVGGGAIGVSAAYELAHRGYAVTLVERDDRLSSACSAGNAGLICPSHSTPLATPAARRSALESIVRRDRALSVRVRPDTLSWLARFAAASRADRADRGREAIHGLSVASLELHAELSALGTSFERRGILNVCETRPGLEAVAESPGAGEANRYTADEARALEPSLGPAAAGAIFHREEAHVDPVRYTEAVAAGARAAGATLRTGLTVRSLRVRNGVLLAETSEGPLRAGTVVLAAGVWTGALARALDVHIPLIAGKGHHIEFAPVAGDPRVPLLLHEARLAVTPFSDRLRIAGRVELTRPEPSVESRQVAALQADATRLLPGLAGRDVLRAWAGLRPCAPDGLPVIGRSERAPAIVFATGHAMKGISLAPVTARLVAELVAGEPASHNLTPFSPDRFRPLRRRR